MKQILVQDQNTKHFLDEEGGWTIEAGRARHFPTSLNAIVHCLQKELGHVRLLIRVDGSQCHDLIINIDEERSRTARDFAAQSRTER